MGLCAAGESQGLASIEALDPAPPRHSPDATYAPDISGDPRRYTSAYIAGARVARLSLAADAADMPALADDSDDEGDTYEEARYDITPASVMFIDTSSTLPPAPASVAAARRLPDFGDPFGWRDAILKEVRRV